MNPIEEYLKTPELDCSNTDLIALLIGGNQQKATITARNLFDRFGSLKKIAQLDARTLERFPGIGVASAVRIHAGLRAGRRSLYYQPPIVHIRTPQEAFHFFWPHLSAKQHESLWALFLDRQKRLLLSKRISTGNDQFTIVDPKQIYQIALYIQASGVIIAHNHPSGDPTPSQQDISVTARIEQVGSLLNIPLIDHLIIGNDRFSSFALLGLLCNSKG
ncbi:MAG: hypothetical protein CL916_05330 [Deltaproteobacteria bacterium]|nr:hypothetical protein [Deltaproteobacteria bacterium]